MTTIDKPTTSTEPDDGLPASSAPTQVSERQARQVAEAARETEWRKPSFGKELFLGRFRLGLIEPWPQPSEESTAKGKVFLDALAEFTRTKIDGEQIERDAFIPDEVLTGLADLGAFGMKIDEEYGGLGLSNLDYCRALMLVGSGNPSVSALLSAHQSIGVPQPLKLFGTPEQKKKFLPRLAGGEISAFLLTEPDVGSDPARLRTTAVPTPEGDYLLNGVKLWATNGSVSSLLVVMALVPKSDGHKGGITAFVVESESEGVTVERRNAFLGLRGLENSVTRFHDVRVPKENVIGREGQGLKIALTTLNTGRLSLPAMCVGAGKWSLNVAREWSAARVQWGRPVGGHEAVARKIAFIAATTYGMESMLDLCCMLADDDRNDIRIEAALVKLYASEMAWQMADELIQIRGGRGYETGRLAGRPGRAADLGGAAPAGSAHQPDLRGLNGDHASAHRQGGGRQAPRRRGRHHRTRRRLSPEGEGGAEGEWLLRLVAAESGRRDGAGSGQLLRVRPTGAAHAVRRAGLAQARPIDVLRHVEVAGSPRT